MQFQMELDGAGGIIDAFIKRSKLLLIFVDTIIIQEGTDQWGRPCRVGKGRTKEYNYRPPFTLNYVKAE